MDAFITEHLKGVSRTYAILIPMLPAPLTEPVGLAYLLMRIVDTIEDTPELPTWQRRDRFAALRAALADEKRVIPEELVRPIGETPCERNLMEKIPEVLARIRTLDPLYRDAIGSCAESMIAGVSEFARRSRERGRPYPAIRDARELRSYCYCVAGVVGEMLCAMMAYYLRLPTLNRLRDVAVELGIGLQLVNILKDALKDSQQGRRYLPAVEHPSSQRERGIPLNGAEVTTEASQAEVYRGILEEARRSLRKGVEFVLALPAAARELRSFCGLPIAWGAMTLARAARNPQQAKVGRRAIQSSITRFLQLADDDQALRRWFALMLRCRQPDAR